MPDPLPLDRAPREIAGMFDAIAGRYDLLNRVLSAGRDRSWRRRAVAALQLGGGETVLDLCTGTADLALALVPPQGQASRVLGVDFSSEMLSRGYLKTDAERARGTIALLRGDAEHIPLGDASVDAVTIGFGIRNVASAPAALEEIARVLRPGGRLAILEFGEPQFAPLRALYLWYFRRVLPFVGRMISRHRSAYAYLPASVHTFYTPEAFRRLLSEMGFGDIRVDPLTGGIVYLYSARRS